MDVRKEDTRICKKCLIKDTMGDNYLESLEHYVDQIDSDIKSSDDLYQSRLATCNECDQLFQGCCRICGCFVQVRAAVKNNYCPSTKKKW